MLPSEKWNQFGEDGLEVHGIIVHNTGNELSAQENYNYLLTTVESNGCHFLLDDIQTIQCLPTNWKAWTTGKGKDWSFNNCLSLEICNLVSNEDYANCEARAVALIKEWLQAYNLTTDDIYFHQEFNEQTYCPNRILDNDKTKEHWIERNFNGGTNTI